MAIKGTVYRFYMGGPRNLPQPRNTVPFRGYKNLIELVNENLSDALLGIDYTASFVLNLVWMAPPKH